MWYLKLLYTVSILLAAEHFHRIKCQTTSTAVQEISLEQYSFHVHVESEKWGCTGILISKYYVLTAAYCVNGSSETKVYLATRRSYLDNQQYQKEEGQIIRVSNLIVHDNFTKSGNENIPYYNNIALLKLSNASTFGKKVHPGILASPEEIAEAFNKNIIVTGWTPQSHDNLSITQAYLQSQQLPKNNLNDQILYMKWIDPKHILNLVGNVLSFKGKIIGIVNKGYYGTGLNLSPFLDWISRSTNITVAELTGTPKKCEELFKDSEKNQKQNEIDHKTLADTITTLSKKVDTTLESKVSYLDLKLLIKRVESLENAVKTNYNDQKNLLSNSIARIETIEKHEKKNEFTQVALMDNITSLNKTIESTEAKILDVDSKLTTKCLERLGNAEQSVTLLNQEIKNLKMEIFNLNKTITDIAIINIEPA